MKGNLGNRKIKSYIYVTTSLSSAGGLVTAVAPVVVECNGLWVGWTGLEVSEEHKY